MRIRLTIAALLVAVAAAYAEPITREQARERAAAFLSAKPGSRKLKAADNQSPRRKVRKLRGLTADTLDLYYVFDRGQDEGFVIVSGDDQTVPVLGYTDHGHFDYAQMPENMRFWLRGYENELEAIRSSAPPIVGANIPIHDPVATLCTSKWNQGDPYNQSCPMYFNLGRSVTGCVATAMAQVLYYNRAKSVTETQAEIPAYEDWAANPSTGEKMWVEAVPANSPIDWDNMTDTYSSSATAKQKKAVADLMWYCGASVQMGYTNSSSGANSWRVADALRNYFGYGESVQYHYFESEGLNEIQWDAMIYNEVSNSRPIYLSGANSSGGHAFVCDGYDGNQCYHINWGWGGSSDGYYLLSSLLPGSQGIGGSDGGYSQQRECVIGIEPINFETRTLPIANTVLKRLCTEAFDKDGDGVLTYGEAAEVTDLGDTFKGKTITDFQELYNFTGLTEIPDDAFSGCTRLTAIKLPKSIKKIGANAFNGCRALKEINLRDDISQIGEGAFSGCTKLPNITLPASLTSIEANTFENCSAFTAVTLPLGIRNIGSRAFAGCTKLKTVTVNSIAPEMISLGEDVWEGIDLSGATLNALQGSRDYFAGTPQWNAFGNVYQQRTLSGGDYATIESNTYYYVYNVGTGRYLTSGEAYNTQAVVADTDEPMRFQLRRNATMAEGVYYLYSPDTENNNHVLFRTSTDGKVGAGVKACFVDGPTSHVTDKSALWQLTLVEGTENIYTMQIPSNASGYTEGEYLGVQPSHASNAAVPTYGIYSDIVYADYSSNCQWMFTPYDAAKLVTFQKARQLENLLAAAKKKKLDTTNEDAVYNNFYSADDDIDKACSRLRKKLNLINFKDKALRNACLNSVDSNSDGEISFDEATSVEYFDGIMSKNTALVDATDLKYFTNLKYLVGNEFQNCTALQTVVLPENLTGVFYRAFMGCTKLESVELPLHLNNIGDNAFTNCRALKEVRVNAPDPDAIDLGTNVFSGVTLSGVVLYVPYGCKDVYAAADVWKDFGEIREMRAMQWPKYAEPVADTDYYVYNIGQKAYINKGEAYGTQAVVASQPLVYQLKHTASMPEGTFYLTSTAGTVFRTTSDSKVGVGVKACFADGSVSAKAYWTLNNIGNNIYTMAVPANQTDHVDSEYLGVDINHTTDFTYATYGLYWDINGSEVIPEGAQWAFISVDEINTARNLFTLTETLKDLIDKARAQSIEVSAEQAVYDNFESSEQQITDAISSLRTKMHFTDFVDTRVKTLTAGRWDIDDDGELSAEELAEVTDISTVFKGATAIKSLEDLQYFSALTEIPEEAFRGNTNLISATLPEGVNTIGKNAFYSTSKLKYLALLNSAGVVDGSASGATVKSLTLFVPEALVEAYKADAFWSAANVVPYTGVPTITGANAARQYGRTLSTYGYTVSGAPINGEPVLTTETDATTVVGDYDILVAPGTVTSHNVQLVNGTLTVERAPITVTALSYTRAYGEENPTFEVKYSTLRNREKIADVLLKEPVIECDATKESYAGVYEIRVSGAEAQNYEFTYVAGKLTIEGGPDGIEAVDSKSVQADTYDLNGRKVSDRQADKRQLQRGIYIRDKHKIAVK